MHLTTFFIDYADHVLVEGDNMESFLKYKLMAARKLGFHTQIVYIQHTHESSMEGCVHNVYSAHDYLFSEPKIHPWGQLLPINCPKCCCIHPWAKPSHPSNGDLVFRCRVNGVASTCTYMVRIAQPTGLEIVTKDVGKGMWYKRKLAIGPI